MQWIHLLRHQAVIKFVSCLFLYTIFLWSVQGFVLATTTSTTSTDQIVADTTPPVISGVSITNITDSGATVNWTTDEPANESLVDFGEADTPYINTASPSGYGWNALVTSHSVKLSPTYMTVGYTFKAGTKYYIRIRVKDASGNSSMTPNLAYSFTTLGTAPAPTAPQDTAPPVISNVVVTPYTNHAVISWNTNEPTTGKYEWSTFDFARGSYPAGSSADTSLATNHSLDNKTLYIEYTYFYKLTATDAAGNISTYTGSLKTLPEPGSGYCFINSTMSDVRDLPSAPDVGVGYAKKKKDGVNSVEALMTACTQADFDALRATYCAQNAGYPFYYEVRSVHSINPQGFSSWPTANTQIVNYCTTDRAILFPSSPSPTSTGSGSTPTTSSPSPSSPPSSGDSSLIGHWKFDGNGNNEVAGGPSAFAIGSASFKSSGGKLDGYAYIPGSNDYIKIPYSSVFDLANSFTVEFWFRQRSNQSFNQDLVYKGSAPNNYNFKIFRYLWNQYNNGAVIAGSTALGTGYWHQASNPNEPPHNVWHHVVYARSPELQAYYIDGSLIHSRNYTQSWEKDYVGPVKTPAVDIVIGKPAPDTDIDNLRIYNRALSASEAAENGGFPPPSALPPPPPPPPPPSPTTTSTPSTTSTQTNILPLISPVYSTTSSPTSTNAIPYQPILPITLTPLTLPSTATSAPIVPSPFLEVICADGSRMPSGAGCPALVVFICANGEKVKSPSECTPTKPPQPPADAVTLCVSYGGMWCADRCVPRGSICGGVGESGGAKVVIDVNQVKEFEAQKRELIREIRLAERALRQAKQNPDVLEASRLKDTLEEVKLRESPDALRDLATLQQAAEKLNEKAEAARERRLQDPGAVEADARAKEKNLRGIKQQIRPFERHVVTLEGRVKEFEKAGVAVDPSVKAALAEARGIAQKIKVAKNYDAADEAVENMLDVAAVLNDLAPAVESASRVLEVARLLERQIVTADRALQQTVKLARRLKLDSSEDIGEMRALLEQAKAALAAIKTGGIDKGLLSEYAETQVIDAVDEIAEIADHFRIITNVRRHVTKVTADFKQYDSRIRREERKKKDMTDARALVDEGRVHLAELQKLVTSRLTVENAEAMLELMRSINDVKEELDKLLGIAKPSALERDLERVIESGGTKVKSYNADAVEKLLI